MLLVAKTEIPLYFVNCGALSDPMNGKVDCTAKTEGSSDIPTAVVQATLSRVVIYVHIKRVE